MTVHDFIFSKRQNGMLVSFIYLSGSVRPRGCCVLSALLLLPPLPGSHDHIIQSRRQSATFWKGKERQARVASGMVTPLPTPPKRKVVEDPAAPPRCECKCSQSDEEGWVLAAETCLHDSNRITHPDSGRHSSRWLTCSNINPVHSATAPFEDKTMISKGTLFS